MTALFIHGFASSGRSGKVQQLERILGEEVLAPSLEHRPTADFARLKEIVDRHRVRTVIGSSMGGFYAIALAQRFDERLVLINPAIHADESTRRYLGQHTVSDTGATFEWTERQLEELRVIRSIVDEALDGSRSGLTWSNVLVLLAERDDVLSARDSAARLRRGHILLDSNQDHRFQDLMPYADRIRATDRAPSDIGPPDFE